MSRIGAAVCRDPETRKLVGLVTDRDIARTCNPPTCRPEDDLCSAVEEMETYPVRRLPVVSRDGQLVGILWLADVVTRTEAVEKQPGMGKPISKPASPPAA